MTLFNSLLADIFERVMDEGRKLMIFSKKQTFSSKEVQSAVKLLFAGELGKQAVRNANDSLAKYAENCKN